MILKNGQEIEIRKAEKDDAQQLIDYLSAVGGESDNLLFGAGEFTLTVEQEERIIEANADSTTAGLFVGIVNGEIIALANLATPARARIAHTCETAISVRQRFWGMGVGMAVMKHLIQFAKDSNQIEIIELGVKADNERARTMYQKLGFTEIGCYPKYFKINGSYYDKILMNLYL
jgi:RimJ/RimL family protein N-acetyltransferase